MSVARDGTIRLEPDHPLAPPLGSRWDPSGFRYCLPRSFVGGLLRCVRCSQGALTEKPANRGRETKATSGPHVGDPRNPRSKKLLCLMLVRERVIA